MSVAITLPAIVAAITEEIPGTFRDAIDEQRRGTPDYVRDGQPESIVGKIGQGITRAACRRYGADPDRVSGPKAASYERICRPYLDTLEPGKGPTLGAPSSGGRCAVSYRVSFEFRKRVSSQFQCGQFGAWTQVTGANFVFPSGPRTGPISGPVERLVPKANDPSEGNQSFAFQTAQGEAFLNLEGTSVRSYEISCGPSYEVRNVRFVRVDGLPDDCGPQPPGLTEPEPIADPTPPPFRFNPAPNVDIDIDVDINPSGDIVFDIGTGPITIDPFRDSDGGGGGGGGGTPAPNPDGPPGDVGSPGAPSDTGTGGESSGSAPEGSVLVGVKIDFVSLPASPNKYAVDVFRSVCYVYMGTATGLDHDPAGAMMRDGQFVFAEKTNLTHWRVRANVGWNLRTTPYYREVS